MEDRGYGFYDKEGNYYLVRCHDCDRENYSGMVATGECAWCGSTKKPKKKNKTKTVNELNFDEQ